MSQQEQAWVDAARRGDRQAFGALVTAYQRPVFNLTYRMLGSMDEAEDAAQETFLRAYTRLDQYDPALKFSTWLFSIANHHCIDRLRKRRTTQISIDDNPVLENLESDVPLPEGSALDGEMRREMQGLLNQLEPEYRTPLILRYWEDLSYEEIATALAVTVPAVKSRLFRARRQLADLYQNRPMSGAPAVRTTEATSRTRQGSGTRMMNFVAAGA